MFVVRSRVVAVALVTGLLGQPADAFTLDQSVEVMRPDGTQLEGRWWIERGVGRFEVADGYIVCGGVYNAFALDPVLTASIVCSDGRQGSVEMRRDSSLARGEGTYTLDDGEEGRVFFGSPEI